MSVAVRPSYESINYDLRPGKNIERKMLSEALASLTPFGAVKTYSYKGFGSTYFTDFALFHRLLGISKMDSIEQDATNRGRFEFNKPLGCIKLHFGKSTNVLPGLEWNNRTILWLDYDGKLSHTVLADIAIFCQRARSGSVLIISVNARPDHNENARRAKLQRQLQTLHKIPTDVTNLSLGGWGTARVSRRIIYNEIMECIARVNAGLLPLEQKTYRQLFNFHYKDSAEMLTTGGVIFDQAENARYEACHFTENCEFVKTGEEPYSIEVPNLTFRELHHLNQQLPRDGVLSARGVPLEDLERYRKVYRWFPRFSETEFY